MSVQSVQFEILNTAVQVMASAQLNVFRCRFSDFTTDELPAVNVVPEDETPEEDNTNDIEQTHRFHVRHLAAAVTGADAIADELYVLATQALLADPTLGGIVRRVKLTGRKWEMEKSALQVMAIVATYEVTYSTSRNDPSVAGY